MRNNLYNYVAQEKVVEINLSEVEYMKGFEDYIEEEHEEELEQYLIRE